MFGEYVVPRVVQHVALDVEYGMASVGLVDDRLQVVDAGRQERLERPVESGPLRLPVTRVIHALHSVHVARVRFVQGGYP